MRNLLCCLALVLVTCRPPPPPYPLDHGRMPARPTLPGQRHLPPLNREPNLRVLVFNGKDLEIDLLQPAVIDRHSIKEGSHRLAAAKSILMLDGVDLRIQEVDLVFANTGRPTLACGAGRYRRRFASDFRLLAQGDQVAIIELIDLESFLYGTLAKEVGQAWPLEALKAQSVVARSYAVAQYLRYVDRPWHLAAFETVDMAYAGLVDQPHVRLQTALEQTRGNLLMYHDMPVPAFFHACSGGYTENPEHVWPERLCIDERTPLGPIMPSVADPWAQRGAALLGQNHWSWRADISLAALAKALRPGAEDRILSLQVVSRYPDSGRSAQVEIRWRSAGIHRITAHGLRMAADPRQVRSTLWTAFGVVDDSLVITGRGFGHGVGLSQVSAYAMAQEGGMLAPAILAHFYPGATLVRRW